MDKRANNGGTRPNSGRKSKAEELGLKEKLQPLESIFHEKLKEQMEAGNMLALKMFAEYYYGKPVDNVDVTTDGEKISSLQVEITRRGIED